MRSRSTGTSSGCKNSARRSSPCPVPVGFHALSTVPTGVYQTKKRFGGAATGRARRSDALPRGRGDPRRSPRRYARTVRRLIGFTVKLLRCGAEVEEGRALGDARGELTNVAVVLESSVRRRRQRARVFVPGHAAVSVDEPFRGQTAPNDAAVRERRAGNLRDSCSSAFMIGRDHRPVRSGRWQARDRDRAIAPQPIEVLEGEAERIEQRVTADCRRPSPVSSTSCCRAVFVGSGAGRLVSMSSGGGCGRRARRAASRMNLPRSTGDDSEPWAKLPMMLPCVSSPAR